MRLFGSYLIMLVLFAGVFAGCSSDDDDNPVIPGRVPVVQQITDNASFDGNPLFTGNGTWIIYESEVGVNRDVNRDIWRIPASGGTAERLTLDEAFDSSPSSTFDGSAIVFESERSGTKALWIMYPDTPGSVPVQLTDSINGDASPEYSPDGTMVVFESAREKDQGSDIWIVAVGDGTVTRVTTTDEGVYNRSAAWSPDGTEIVFESIVEGFSALYTLPIAGGELTRITGLQGYEGHPAWSPDGSEILFESTKSGVSEIYSVSSTGGEVTQITIHGGNWPQWSADGTKIVFGVFGSAEPNIWTMDVDW